MRQALAIYERTREFDRSAAVYKQLGDSARAMNRYEDARQFYREARALLGLSADRRMSARVTLMQGLIEDDMQGFDAAADFYTQAAALAANENDPHLLGEIAEAMARLEQRRDRPAQAHELLDNALAQYGAAGDLAAQARVRESLMQLDAGRRPAAEPRN